MAEPALCGPSGGLDDAVHRDDMTLSVVIPARNEEAHLRETVEAIVKVLRGKDIVHELLIVNDHSTDNTAHVAQEFSQ